MARLRALVLGLGMWMSMASWANAQVTLSYPADSATLGPIPDGPSTLPTPDICASIFDSRPRLVNFTVPSQSVVVDSVRLSITVTHPRIMDLLIRLHAPDGSSHAIFEQPGVPVQGPQGYPGSLRGLAGTYVFADDATGDLWAATESGPPVVPPGAYRTGVSYLKRGPTSMDMAFVGHAATGTWTLEVLDSCETKTGTITAAALTLIGKPGTSAVATSTTLGSIPDGASGATTQTPGPPRDVTFVVGPGRGPVKSVRMSATLAHPRVGDLVATLIAPNGSSHVLFGYTGATTAQSAGFARSLGGRYEFHDLAAGDWWATAGAPPIGPIPPGSYRTSEAGGAGRTGAVTPMNPVFAGVASAGVWTLRLTDGFAGDRGVIGGASLILETFTTPTTMADGFATGYLAPVTIAAPGLLANDTDNLGGALTAQVVSGPANGQLSLAASGAFTYVPNLHFVGTDTFTYRATNAGGPGNVATVSIAVAAPLTVQPPTELRVSSLTGNVVTLRWIPAPAGPTATDFVVEGGVAPGQVLGGFATGRPLPILTASLPTGAFYLRVHAIDASGLRSGPSNEIPVFVNTPAAPSAPASITGMVTGSAFGLSWRNTFAGGAPTSLQLNVSGSALATLPLPLGETFSFAGVPAGTYTFRVRAVNAAGTSVDSAPVTLTFPNGCTGAPAPPLNVLAYTVGTVVHIAWDPPATGAAPSSYVLHVGGGFTGTFPLATRNFSAPAPSGAYALSLSAVNACGSSAQTAPQTVFVP